MLTHEYKVIEEDYISRFQEAINEAAQEGYTLQSYQHTAHHDEDRPTMLAFTWTAIMSRSVAGTEYSPDKRIEDIADVRGITPQELISEALDTPEPAPGDFRFTFEPGRASGRRKGLGQALHQRQSQREVRTRHHRRLVARERTGRPCHRQRDS